MSSKRDMIKQLTRALFDCFSRHYAGDSTPIMYQIAFKDFTTEQLTEVYSWASIQARMPTIGQMLDHLGIDREPSQDDWIEYGWAALLKHADTYHTVMFSDTRVTKAIRILGGWQYVCDRLSAGNSELVWLKKEFAVAFRAADKLPPYPHPNQGLAIVGSGCRVRHAIVGDASQQKYLPAIPTNHGQIASSVGQAGAQAVSHALKFQEIPTDVE